MVAEKVIISKSSVRGTTGSRKKNCYTDTLYATQLVEVIRCTFRLLHAKGVMRGYILVTITFLVVGGGFFYAGFVYKNEQKQFMASAQEAMATITRIDSYTSWDDEHDEHDVYVVFFVDGTEYGGKLGDYSSNMHEGKEIPVYYDPANPQDFRSGEEYLWGWAWIIFGGIFILMGIMILIYGVITCVFGEKTNEKKLEEIEAEENEPWSLLLDFS